MRHLLPILILCCFATGTLLAAGVWDFHGGAGLNAGRTDNPGFVSTNNPSSGTQRRSDTSVSLRLTGGVSGQWAATRFNLNYSPFATLYHNQSELSQVSHNLNSTWNHSYTARTTLSMDAIVNYTPEQDVDPNGQSTNRIYVGRTDQLSSGLRAGYAFAATAKNTITGSYRYAVRTYGSDEFVDSTTHNLGVTWRRRVTSRSFVQSGYEYGQFLYGDGPPIPKIPNEPRDPNAVRSRDFDSSHHQASVGYGVDVGRGFKLTANAGYNILLPVDSHLDSNSGLYLNGQADWSGTKLSATTGYVHSLADGSGAFANAVADSLRANLRYAFTPKVSSDVSLARNVNERVAGGTNQGNETVRTIYARASVNWAFAKTWSADASFARFTQDQNGSGTQTPDIRSNRWSAGVSWSIQ